MGTVVLGAGGRLGRLLRPVFPDTATWKTRSDTDVLDMESLKQALTGADTVICLAGVTHTSAQPMEMNATIAGRVLDSAEAVGAGRVILFSSAAVYGHTPSPLFEAGPVAPTTPYGHAKLAMETIAAHHPHPNTTLRLGNVAGADAILGNWKPGFFLDTFADGTTPRRSYIGPIAIARLLCEMTGIMTLPKLINVATPGTVQMGQLLDAAELPWQSRPASDATVADVALDTGTLEKLTSFDPNDSTAHGIVADWHAAVNAQ